MPLLNLFNIQILNSQLLLRFSINLVFTIILIRGIYYTYYKRSDLFLTYFSFNSIIFFVGYMLNKVELSAGSAFGLFAVFFHIAISHRRHSGKRPDLPVFEYCDWFANCNQYRQLSGNFYHLRVHIDDNIFAGKQYAH